MKATKQRLFIDFEASSLEPQSYPIEVAFSDPNGGKPISYLINPYLIEEWTDWDPYAQNKIHGISRKMLREEGKSPLYVAREMNRLLGGYELYCDGGDYDRFWCDRLFNAVWLDRQFRIRDSQELFHKAIRLERSLTEALLDVPSSVASKNRIIARLAGKAKSITPGKRHRAAVDVEYLENLYRLVKEWPAGEHKKADFSGHKEERCFIDFQASGLSVSKGYPIQVAWSLPIGVVESWFIRPDNNWDADEGWDAKTEAQHSFSRTFIHEDGCDTKWLCRRMNEQLAGQTLYTDDVPHDIRWLDQLFESGEERREFEIADFYELLDTLLPERITRKFGWYNPFREAAWKRVKGGRYDAGNNVQCLIECYRIASARFNGDT